MTLSAHDSDLIEKSIDGSLSREETIEFERKEKESEEFRDAIAYQRKLLAMIEAQQKSELKMELTQLLHETKIDGKSSEKPSTTRWYWIAASTILLLGAFWVFQNQISTSTSLVEKYYRPYPNVLSSRLPDVDWVWLQLYSEGKYGAVISRLEEISAKTDTINFYLAMSYMSSDNYDKATEELINIESSSIFHQHKTWYLGLSKIALGENKEARALFAQIKPAEFKYEESRELLEQLD